MSLISEALKTAQQQRSQRVESSGGNPFFDGFFPYAERAARASASSRLVLIGGISAILIASAGAVAWMRIANGRSTTIARPATPAFAAPSRKSAPLPTAASSPAPQQAGAPRVAPTAPAPVNAHTSPSVRSVQSIPIVSRVAKLPEKPIAPSAAPVAASVAPTKSAATTTEPASPPKGLQVTVGAESDSPAAALMTQAYAAQRAGDLDAAKSLYDRALAVGPGTPALYNNVGALLVARNEAQKAVPTLKLALQLDPSYVNSWVNLGNAYEQLGEHAQAIGAYSQALKYDPENGATKSNLAQQYIAVGALDDARRLLDDVMHATPNSAIVHYRLGELLEKQRDVNGAVREFTRFLELGGAPSQPGFDDRLKAHIVTLRSNP